MAQYPDGENRINVTVLTGNGPDGEVSFSESFVIGRSRECGLQIKENAVSRQHARIDLDGASWLLHDLGSGNGTYLNGQRIQGPVRLPDSAVIELGKDGPRFSLEILRKSLSQSTQQHYPDEEPITETVPLSPSTGSPSVDMKAKPEFASETQIMKHYFAKGDSGDAGEQTMMFRRAFDRAHKKKSRKYYYFIGLAVLLLIVAGSVILFQKQKLQKMRATAESIFYVAKGLELQIGKLEEDLLKNADPGQVADLRAKRAKFKGMEQEYDNFIKELGVYAKLPEEEKVIMRVARVFGECEVNMPKGFVDEVKRYVAAWKSTDRLQSALNRAQQKGYTPIIIKTLSDNNLPPQYFFLALQESNFNDQAVGPSTRYGHAKGMWQFISPTANRFGLQIGPLYDRPVYDPQDDRFNVPKATVAAMKYIRELNNSSAQASGLLVMASYNWGEGNVRQIIDQMPPNPRERNFWRLLSIKNVPKETYDYVFSIFSAAVICENPKLFGFDCNCPSFKPMEQSAPQGSGSVKPMS